MASSHFTVWRRGRAYVQRRPNLFIEGSVEPTVAPQYPTMTLLGVPLAVRLRTTNADTFVSAEVDNLSFRSTVPGGFASAQMTLNRPLSLDPPEIQLYGDLIVYDGRSGKTVWQGRLEDPGRAAGAQGEKWAVTAVGPAAHTRDRTQPLIYVDRSLERWFRHVDAATQPDGTERIQPDQGGSAVTSLHLQHPRGTVVPTDGVIGREYRAIREAGQKLARVDYNTDAGQTAATWFEQLVTVPSVTIARSQTQATGGNAASARVVVTDWADGDDQPEVRLLINPGGTVAGDTGWSSFMNLYVVAMRFNKDATEKTTGYTTSTVLASEIVADLLGRLLTEYDGANATVTATTYAITQLAYPDGVTAADVLKDLMQIEPGFYWAAYEESTLIAGRFRFEWTAWPSTVRYEASAQDGLDSPGSATDLYNAVMVRWRDTDGTIKRTVRTQTVAVLTAAGLTRQAFIDLGDEVASSANAIQVGDRFLAEHATPPNAGTLTVGSQIFDSVLGMRVSPWEIRPGYLIRVRDVKPRVDALNATARDSVTVFKIVGVDYDARSNTARLELDSSPLSIVHQVGIASEARRR